jgi:predicted methyltransferase
MGEVGMRGIGILSDPDATGQAVGGLRPGHIVALAALAGFLALMVSGAPAGAQGSGSDAAARLRAAIAGEHREAQNRARDAYRHPFETLAFFGIEPDMTVVEIWPGGGWYTEILAPFLKGGGRLYAAGWDRDSTSDYVQRALKGYGQKLAGRPDVYGEVIVTELSPSKTDIAPAGSGDMVLTFRSLHNWMRRGYERAIFEAMFDALKPGGVLGLVQHRGDPEVWQDPQALSGYVNQETAIELAEDVGYRLVASSEVNANPKDTKDHPEGVWTLPPTLRLKEQDRDTYLAIGESDRMTLKFIKPAQ